MGYTTDFSGQFTLDKPLTKEHREYLEAFNQSRRMKRDAVKTTELPDPIRISAGLGIGRDGGYYVGAAEQDRGQAHDTSVVDYNRPPNGQPGLWCQWTPTRDGAGIEWDEGEKFTYYAEWLNYLCTNFLAPWGYTLDGQVHWVGEDSDDRGVLYAKANQVQAVASVISNPGPKW